MKLDEQLPDRGRGSPVRPGGSSGIGAFVFAAVLIIGGAGAYIVSQSEERWYGSPIKPTETRPDEAAGAVAGSEVSRRLQPAGSPQNWVTDDDYPPEALRRGWQGTVGFALDVSTDGRPESCTVTQSSGTRLLDDAACDLLMRRARFIGARDGSGRPISAKFTSRFTWRIPE